MDDNNCWFLFNLCLKLLEDCCSKQKLDPEKYALKHHNKLVDLSLMFRFSSLPNNCVLEMVESRARPTAEVILCLQLEDGSRLNGTFESSILLIDVLEQLYPNYVKQDAVIIFMRKEVFGDNLRSTTLKSLGLTGGRALLRLLHKTPEELKT